MDPRWPTMSKAPYVRPKSSSGCWFCSLAAHLKSASQFQTTIPDQTALLSEHVYPLHSSSRDLLEPWFCPPALCRQGVWQTQPSLTWRGNAEHAKAQPFSQTRGSSPGWRRCVSRPRLSRISSLNYFHVCVSVSSHKDNEKFLSSVVSVVPSY